MRHLPTTAGLLLFVTAFTLAMAVPTMAQGTETGAAAPEKLTLERKVVEPEETAAPVPYNILDDADDDMVLCLTGWSTKYRIDPKIQDGTWVKYESVGDGPKETLKIQAKLVEEGTWIIETTTIDGVKGSTELHLLFSPGKPKLLKLFRIAADGTREDMTPLDDYKSGELFLEARQMALDALGGDRNDIRVYDSGDVQKIEGPFGSLLCRSIGVRVAEYVDPISFATKRRWLPEGTLLWLSDEVPRLMPMEDVLLPSLLSPDDYQSVWGGLVKSPYHVLVSYGVGE